MRSKVRIYELVLSHRGTHTRGSGSESSRRNHMAVLEQVTDQITDATDKFFDAAESANERAHGATKNLVARIEKGDIPFADRVAKIDVPFADRLPEVKIPEVKLPLVDKLPEPQEAVDAYFGFWSKGIEANRAFSEKVMNRISDAPAVIEVPSKKAPAKKATAKKTATKKTTAKKTTAKK